MRLTLGILGDEVNDRCTQPVEPAKILPLRQARVADFAAIDPAIGLARTGPNRQQDRAPGSYVSDQTRQHRTLFWLRQVKETVPPQSTVKFALQIKVSDVLHLPISVGEMITRDVQHRRRKIHPGYGIAPF